MKKLSMHRFWGLFSQLALSLATLSALVLGAPSRSLACKCAEPPPPTEALAQSTAVFEGQVTQLNATADELEVTLRVTRAWKGADKEKETIRVRTRKDSAACGVPFEAGQSWLVYANQTTEHDSAITLSVLRCGRSRLAEEASEDFAALGLGVVTVSPRDPAATPPAEPAKPLAAPAQPGQSETIEPAAGGCASCSLGRAPSERPSFAGFGVTLLAAIVIARSRRRARSHGR
jgi:hypothetical protein